MLFFSSIYLVGMPKTAGIPKSLLADLNKVKTRLSTLEKNHASLIKEVKNSAKSFNDMLKKQQGTIAQLGKKAVKKEKRKPSEYNLFLKEKMSAGMSMVDAVKAWKEKEGGTSSSSSMRQTSQEWQSPTQQY